MSRINLTLTHARALFSSSATSESAARLSRFLSSSSSSSYEPQGQISNEEEPKGGDDKEVGGEERVEDGDAEEGGTYVNKETGEVGGPRGPEPTRYGDWERNGRCSDF